MMFQKPLDLYSLIPAFYRNRDAAVGEPLRALLEILAEQGHHLEDNLERTYRNWFVETCDDWVLPYLADLIGYRRAAGAGQPGDASTERGALLNRYLFPRREIANSIRLRRRKGTLAVLNELAAKVADWEGVAFEFGERVLQTPDTRSQRTGNQWPTTPRIWGESKEKVPSSPADWLPLGTAARTVDVRRPHSLSAIGWFHPFHLALFVWRRKVVSVTDARPGQAGDRQRYWTVDLSGCDRTLHQRPDPNSTSDFCRLPLPLTRGMLSRSGRASPAYYGLQNSLSISRWHNNSWQLIPSQQVRVHKLSDDDQLLAGRSVFDRDPTCQVVFDPECGRFLTRDMETVPPANFRVRYHLGTAGDCGAREFLRTDIEEADVPAHWVPPPSPGQERDLARELQTMENVKFTDPQHLRVTGDCRLELTSSDLHDWPADWTLELADGVKLTIRGIPQTRPAVRVISENAGSARISPWPIRLGRESQLVLEGLLLTGPLQFDCTPDPVDGADASTFAAPEIVVRHSTLLPDTGGQRVSLDLGLPQVRLHLESCVLGPIRIRDSDAECASEGATTCPVRRVRVFAYDTIWDAGSSDLLSADDHFPVEITVARSTLLGDLELAGPLFADDTLFYGSLDVERTQEGYLRFCQLSEEPDSSPVLFKCATNLSPVFVSLDPCHPGYAQLAPETPLGILRGAQTESEIGAFHDQFFPQRSAALKLRLDEFTPAELRSFVVFADDRMPPLKR